MLNNPAIKSLKSYLRQKQINNSPHRALLMDSALALCSGVAVQSLQYVPHYLQSVLQFSHTLIGGIVIQNWSLP